MSNALQTTNLKTPWSGPSLPPSVAKLLVSEGSDIVTPEQAAEIRAVLPALAYAPEPAGGAVVRRMVGKAALAYPSAKLNDQEAALRLEVYADALSDLPADVLGLAFLEAVKTIKFFPSIAEIRTLAGREIGRRRYLEWRAKDLLDRHDRERCAAQVPNDEERAELARLMSGLVKSLAA